MLRIISLFALVLTLAACSAGPETADSPATTGTAAPVSQPAAQTPNQPVASPTPGQNNPGGQSTQSGTGQPGDDQTSPGSLAIGAALAMPKDGFQLQGVSIDGDTLSVKVGYGGGCEAHDFRMHWNGSFMKSNPPRVALTLHHDGHGDQCEAYISETIAVDLAPIRERLGGASGHVVIRIGDQRADLRW